MSSKANVSDQWLIRTQQNMISGPVSRERLLQLIGEGKLGPQDEVCRAHSYWFYLHEEPETVAQLGIHAVRGISNSDEEEITETETRSDLFPTFTVEDIGDSPEQTAMFRRRSPQPLVQAHSESATMPLQNSPPQEDLSAAPVIRQAGFVAPSLTAGGADSGAQGPVVQVVGSAIAKRTIWSGLVWLLLLGAIGALIAVLRVLNNSP